ncbi:aminoacyl-tRNA hydrolase [Flavihumibacter sp. CACIAM 22H1]|uniref:aminoacyl-tRNA hydrolase n=1 Tax=Flavihumibacter sp. CACIAM 22H1 TaxID=1812911 RepID=UPI0007A7D198|nr:aminoacyl-tRNA hydrolase [Flavihumibacter sp. CACIAM 22H1]KYP12982.1 MAG: aminoacyl-tRNA hydrolase [Flavihumibacter sp. CACIAM 22H1]
MNKFLIVGLGNIGAEYAHTRHNIGFDVVDALAAKYGVAFRTDRLADVAETRIKGKSMLLIKPSTYMNLSGKAVKYWMDKEKIPVEQVFIILDELALPIEKSRIRGAGSDGGHNGLKSIQEQLGTTAYPRLRFGIGNNYPKGRQVDYVLGRWEPEEAELIRLKIEKTIPIIESFVLAGLATTMNHFNNVEYKL